MWNGLGPWDTYRKCEQKSERKQERWGERERESGEASYLYSIRRHMECVHIEMADTWLLLLWSVWINMVLMTWHSPIWPLGMWWHRNQTLGLACTWWKQTNKSCLINKYVHRVIHGIWGDRRLRTSMLYNETANGILKTGSFSQSRVHKVYWLKLVSKTRQHWSFSPSRGAHSEVWWADW